MQSPLWKAKAVVDELQDLVWTVNTSPPTRWRLYVTYDVLDTPTAFLSKAEKQHRTFLAQRQRSARSAVQLTKFAQLAEGVCEPDVVDTLLFHATYALLELRSAELKVIGYQLLLGTLGFRTQQRDLLFLATHHAYELLSLLWTVANQFGPLQASPRDRRALRDSRPLRVETPNHHATHLTEMIHQLQPFAHDEGPYARVWRHITPLERAYETAGAVLQRWGHLVRALDQVVVLAPEAIPHPPGVPGCPPSESGPPSSSDAGGERGWTPEGERAAGSESSSAVSAAVVVVRDSAEDGLARRPSRILV